MVCHGDDCALVFQFQFKVMSLVPPVVGLVGPAWCTVGWSGAGNDLQEGWENEVLGGGKCRSDMKTWRYEG